MENNINSQKNYEGDPFEKIKKLLINR